jgi:hypothetical protein
MNRKGTMLRCSAQRRTLNTENTRCTKSTDIFIPPLCVLCVFVVPIVLYVLKNVKCFFLSLSFLQSVVGTVIALG